MKNRPIRKEIPVQARLPDGQAHAGPRRRGLAWILIGTLSGLLALSLYLPQHAGEGGRFLKRLAGYGFGKAAHLIPWLALYAMAGIFKAERAAASRRLIGGLLVLVAVAAASSLLSSALTRPNWGGYTGKILSEEVLMPLLGGKGAALVTLSLFITGLLIATEISASQIGLFLQKEGRLFLARLKRPTGASASARSAGPVVALPRPILLPIQEKLLDARGSDFGVRVSAKTGSQKQKTKNGEPQTAHRKPLTANRSPLPEYRLPGMDLLERPKGAVMISQEETLTISRKLEEALNSFHLSTRVVRVHPGPVVTRYDLEPAPGVSVKALISHQADLALTVKAKSIRVYLEQGVVAVEIPNPHPSIVSLREVLESPAFSTSLAPLPIALGRSANGEILVEDLSNMPHLLIAGATGSGKSVFIHSLILSLIYRLNPAQLKFLLVDPKRVELPTRYNGIGHLYVPGIDSREARVLTDAREATLALKRLVEVMDSRLSKFSAVSAKDIQEFNAGAEERGEPPEFYIVVVIDELAELMLISRREVEASIQRLSQTARATGIHLVLATQSPRVDVVTGLIKANLPVRLALSVVSRMDSQVVLDMPGAEDLLGKGDALYLPTGAPKPSRIQGCFVSSQEAQRVAAFVKAQGGPQYHEVLEKRAQSAEEDENLRQDIERALRLAMERRKISYDLLKYNGFGNRAADIISRLEGKGFIRKPGGGGRWELDLEKIREHLNATPTHS